MMVNEAYRTIDNIQDALKLGGIANLSFDGSDEGNNFDILEFCVGKNNRSYLWIRRR
jgi:hypothetical protein